MTDPTQAPPEPAYTERMHDALAAGARLHKHQLRKGTTIPYLTHLLET